MFLEKFAMKTFLNRFSLKTGAFSVSAFMIIVMIIMIITTIVEVEKFAALNEHCWWGFGYACCVIVFSHVVIMLAMNIWYIWGIARKKSSVVFGWAIITGVWLIQTIIAFILFIVFKKGTIHIALWILMIIFGIVVICLFIFSWFVGYSFWIELKANKTPVPTTPA